MRDSGSRVVFEFSAGGLVLDDDGRVLLIRARDLRGQPVWTLPKGALVSGETSADAALREVREETGYRCELVAREPGPVLTESGMALHAAALPEPTGIGTLLLPGGNGVRTATRDEAFVAWIREAAAGASSRVEKVPRASKLGIE